MVVWAPPKNDVIKLNTDGVSRGNPGVAAGGGIFRDLNGNIIYAFGNFYGEETNMMAEARAALDGLLLAWEFGIFSVWLEVDYEVLAFILLGK